MDEGCELDMGEQKSDELQKIAEELDSEIGSSDTQSGAKEVKNNNKKDKLSKDKIKEEFDIQFAKKPGNKSQHLVSPGENKTLCGVGLGSDVPISDTPGPFDPVCGNCRRSIGETGAPGMSRYDLREWLSNNVKGLEDPDSTENPSNFRKEELEAIVSHIKSISNE